MLSQNYKSELVSNFASGFLFPAACGMVYIFRDCYMDLSKELIKGSSKLINFDNFDTKLLGMEVLGTMALASMIAVPLLLFKASYDTLSFNNGIYDFSTILVSTSIATTLLYHAESKKEDESNLHNLDQMEDRYNTDNTDYIDHADHADHIDF